MLHLSEDADVLSGALWALIALCVLQSAALVLLYRRLSRDRANAIVSRDRAKFDLQLIIHEVHYYPTLSEPGPNPNPNPNEPEPEPEPEP